MKNFLAAFVLCLGLMTASVDADAARRFGGGGSFGRSAPTFSQKAAPSAPGVQQRANQARPQLPQQQTRPQQPPQPRRSMMRNVLTGLAAALGISALLSMLGLGGAEMASLVMGALLAVVAFFAIRFLLGAFLGRKSAAVRGASVEMPREPVRPAEPERAPEPLRSSPVESVREEPVRRGSVMDEFRSGRFGAAPEEAAAAADAGTADITPDDFDRAAFLRVAKENFVKFQKAWDTGNVIELSDFTTQDLFIEITHALRERGAQNYETTVLQLDNQLVGIAQQGEEYVAVVHFTGKLSVSGEEEIVDDDWILTKPVNKEGGLLLARGSGKS